ncbi:predicted protein [Sclerotinia sclerotiorum 1980 UF-70]|uniref:Uncharacterized protein n=2 Tax=Sclerotinia sclerotiorum (strain ATCC 18683 / 1980 / Ss-1) TaxID=665079 RepID=A7E4M8_SCLS1|nr:predicted protein [Sclerotinia sclerotiorum 1980 UF-70]APA08090.1 hypothetical protein sscle_03g028600 [Sclerotinia sclerotiorum 1980 UF-70]EDN90850.1 predicted protein [Sclerotinia sclerotiorum 1980 UF-70]
MAMWCWRYGISSLSLAGHKHAVAVGIVYSISERIFEECREEWNRIKKATKNDVGDSESGK